MDGYVIAFFSTYFKNECFILGKSNTFAFSEIKRQTKLQNIIHRLGGPCNYVHVLTETQAQFHLFALRILYQAKNYIVSSICTYICITKILGLVEYILTLRCAGPFY